MRFYENDVAMVSQAGFFFRRFHNPSMLGGDEFDEEASERGEVARGLANRCIVRRNRQS